MTARRLAVCVAHPDDETYATFGSVALHAAEPGFRLSVLHATDGGAGEIAPGVKVPRGSRVAAPPRGRARLGRRRPRAGPAPVARPPRRPGERGAAGGAGEPHRRLLGRRAARRGRHFRTRRCDRTPRPHRHECGQRRGVPSWRTRPLLSAAQQLVPCRAACATARAAPGARSSTRPPLRPDRTAWPEPLRVILELPA